MAKNLPKHRNCVIYFKTQFFVFSFVVDVETATFIKLKI